MTTPADFALEIGEPNKNVVEFVNHRYFSSGRVFEVGGGVRRVLAIPSREPRRSYHRTATIIRALGRREIPVFGSSLESS